MTDLRTAAQQALEALEAFLSDELRPYEAAKISAALRAAMAEPVQEPVAQISANRVIAAIEEWKSLWWKVPPFASKVNRATREAITVSHNPLFALLLDAQAAKQMPRGCTTPSGCQQHGCHGDCLPTEPQRPAEPDTDCHAQGICQRSGYGIN
jgi:hypothetical protein